MDIQSLASGSKGNLTIVTTGRTKILIDQGLSAKQANLRLMEAGHKPGDIEAIFVTHEHSDHFHGIRVFGKQHRIPIYMNVKTYELAESKGYLEPVNDVRFFENGEDFQFSDLSIHPFGISHDAVDPVNFIIEHEGKRYGHITDLGFASHLVLQKAKTADYLFLEANHDIKMLDNGPYPINLKRRVKSKFGHLSNEQSADILLDILSEKSLSGVTLIHLSEQNNDPELLKNYMISRLENKNKNVKLEISGQYKIGEIHSL